MNKIINTFKYGSARVKRDLALTILSGVAAAALLICSILFGQMFLFFLAIVFVFVTITMAQTFGIHNVEDDSGIHEGANLEKANTEQSVKNVTDNVSNEEDQVNDTEVEEKKSLFERIFKKKARREKLDNEPQKNNVENRDKKDKKAKREKSSKNEKMEFEDKNQHEDNDVSQVPDEEYDENEEEYVASGDNLNEKSENIEDDELVSEEETQKKVIHQLDEEEVAKYTKKKVKKVMKQYRVKRDHRRVIIDRCEKLGIKQTPAFIWVADKQFNILLIEKDPRHLKFPIFGINAVEYKKKQEANPDIDYAIYKGDNMIAQMFGDYVPDYLHSTVVGDVTAYKNLYCIGPDIRFTNKSAANLFDLLGVEFLVEDKVTSSNKVNIYFKDAYKANILLRDNVFDANGYADRISVILGDMAKSTISYNEFKETLNLMIKNKLITQEFAEHYIGVRDSLKR